MAWEQERWRGKKRKEGGWRQERRQAGGKEGGEEVEKKKKKKDERRNEKKLHGVTKDKDISSIDEFIAYLLGVFGFQPEI